MFFIKSSAYLIELYLPCLFMAFDEESLIDPICNSENTWQVFSI